MAEKIYPEHEKVKAKAKDGTVIGEFLEWLESQGITLCEWDNDKKHEWEKEFHQTTKTTEVLIAEYFGIDLKKFRAEKDEMFEELRKANRGK